ncbi:MAG: hypothetical protein IKH61_02355 [Bacteroidales bacterium]|nr:hypothetical protein [Bacteroidales bacterium]
MGLLRTFLIIVLFFYAFSIIVRLVFKRKMQKLEHQMRTYDQDKAPSVSNEARNPHIDPNIGEYTDFEEVE